MVTPALADEGGNSANAQACQKGGWRELRGSDGTVFASQADCVTYGAHGGVIVPARNLQAEWEAVCTADGWTVKTIFPDGQWRCASSDLGGFITEGAKVAMEEICVQQGWITVGAPVGDQGYTEVACNSSEA